MTSTGYITYVTLSSTKRLSSSISKEPFDGMMMMMMMRRRRRRRRMMMMMMMMMMMTRPFKSL